MVSQYFQRVKFATAVTKRENLWKDVPRSHANTKGVDERGRTKNLYGNAFYILDQNQNQSL